MKKIKHFLCLSAICLITAYALTGCGTDTAAGSTSGNNNTDKNDLSENLSDAAKDVADGAADAAKEAADGATDATKDLADGIGDATNDLLGKGGFDNYNDAHDYFLDTMGSYHADAKFELRDEDKELNDYQEGSKGYHFHLYDTSKNNNGDDFGEFYVDVNSGRIYKKGVNDTVEEYPAAQTDISSRF